jgi:hypothetical protein
LAGEWYRWLVGQHEENPGDPDGRLEYQWAVTDEIEATVGGAPSEIDLGALEVRRKIRPIIADRAETALFLASKGEVLTPAAMMLFLDRVLSEFSTATSRLNRMAAASAIFVTFSHHTKNTTTRSERTYRCRTTRTFGVMCAEQGACVRRRSWAGYTINMFEFEFPTGTGST